MSDAREEESPSRILVTPEQLRRAFRVWMRVLPAYLWRRHEQHLRMAADRRSRPEDRPDPKADLADYMADKFVQAGWEASYPEPPIMTDPRRTPGMGSPGGEPGQDPEGGAGP